MNYEKTLLATAILASLVSVTAQSATVYEQEGTTLDVGGRAEVRADFLGDDYEKVDGSITDKSRARINFSGVTRISEELTGFGFMEYEIKDGESVTNRYLFAGFGTEAGKFSYGRQDTANVQVSDMTDIASYHSGIQQIFDASSDKESNTFLYSGSFADALTVQANYTASEVTDGDSFAISSLYAFDFGLDLAASYTDSESDETQTTLGAAYTLDNLYIAVTYAMGDIDADNDFRSIEAAIQYKFSKEFRMIGVIGQAEEADVDTQDFYAVEAQYRFNRSIRTYVSYAFNNLDNTVQTEDSLVAGIRYNF